MVAMMNYMSRLDTMSNRLGAMDSGAVAATSEAKLNDLRICKFKSILPLPYTSIN